MKTNYFQLQLSLRMYRTLAFQLFPILLLCFRWFYWPLLASAAVFHGYFGSARI